MLKGKGLILKTDECAHAVRISLLEYSFFFTHCFRDTELLMFWSFLNICKFIGIMKDILLFSDMLCHFSPCLCLRAQRKNKMVQNSERILVSLVCILGLQAVCHLLPLPNTRSKNFILFQTTSKLVQTQCSFILWLPNDCKAFSKAVPKFW